MPGTSRVPTPKGARRVRRPIRPRPGRGRPQGGRSPGEPGCREPAEMRTRHPNATRGANPCSEAAPDPKSGTRRRSPTGRRRSGTHGIPIRNTRRPPHHALKPKGDGAGYGPGETRSDERQAPFGSVTPHRQSQEGKLRREAKAILVVSSSEGRTPRARLDETSQGGSDGSKASKPAGTARTQQDPEEATPGVVARPYRVALKGKETSREPNDAGGRRRGAPGETLERG